MAARIFMGGYVLTGDPAIGDVPCGDVLVDGGTIVAVDLWIDHPDAEIIDAAGMVVLPGGRIGSLTPGNPADVILVDAARFDPAGVVQPADMDTVMVGGEFRRRHGRPVSAARARQARPTASAPRRWPAFARLRRLVPRPPR